jgi:hypothetical protein
MTVSYLPFTCDLVIRFADFEPWSHADRPTPVARRDSTVHRVHVHIRWHLFIPPQRCVATTEPTRPHKCPSTFLGVGFVVGTRPTEGPYVCCGFRWSLQHLGACLQTEWASGRVRRPMPACCWSVSTLGACPTVLFLVAHSSRCLVLVLLESSWLRVFPRRRLSSPRRRHWRLVPRFH